MKRLPLVFLTSYVILVGTTITTHKSSAVLRRIRNLQNTNRGASRSSSMPNLSSQLETTPSTSTSNLNQSALKSVSTSTESLDIGSTSNKSVSMPNLSSQETQTPSTSTTSLNTSGAKPKNKFKKFFSRSSSNSSITKEKPTYTVWDYIRGKPITTEMYTQTPSSTFKDVGIQAEPSTRSVGTQYDPPSSPKSGKKQAKTHFLSVFSSKKKSVDLNQSSISQEEINQTSSSNYVKVTTYSHEYRELDRKQIELIKMHQQALQKRLQEHLELLLPDSEQPSTSTSQNLQNAQVKLMERGLKIQELNEKVQDLKNIKTEIGNIGNILANIEPLKRQDREEALAKETAIEGRVVTPQSSPKSKKGLRKFITKL